MTDRDRRRAVLAAAFCLSASALPAADPDAGPNAEEVAFFESQVRPLLIARCGACHGPDKQQGGVRLDTRAGALSTAELSTGAPAVVPGDAAASRLVGVLAHADYDTGMPPAGKLPDAEIALLAAWVDRGAPWPTEEEETPAAGDPADHWAFRPVVLPPVPGAPGSTPIDRFLNAKLSDAGLEPAPPADRRAQVRRLFLGLLGVPPTWEELRSVLSDRSPDWHPRLVDRLLADPRHGERWARRWLDVARYADTRGYVLAGRSGDYPFAWTYRDYVVRAFNGDLPYDRFVTEQLAADRLAAAGELPADDPALAALGFLTLGDRFIDNPVLIADDRVDVTTRGLLGLTVACARCHDHKFDPVPTEDYYALYGVFRSSTDPDELPEIGAPPDTPAARAFAAERARLAAESAAETAKQAAAVDAHLRARFGSYLAAAAGVLPDDDPRRDGLRELGLRHYTRLLENAGPRNPHLAAWVRLREDPADADAAAVDALIARFESPDPADAAATAAANRYATPPGGRWEGFATRPERDAAQKKETALKQFVAASPHAPPRAQALVDGPRREWNTVFIRGDLGRRGKAIVPHAVPSILTGGELVELTADPDSAAAVSGRRELAAAIVDPVNPLTARVLVNRVWAWHFGTGLVDTPSDFGRQGGRPSHPELLDWLAAEFVANGWSLKWLHRTLVSTDAHRREAGPAAGTAADPGNRLLARFPRQRLTFEAWRDAALAVTGALDERIGGRPAPLFGDDATRRRTLYGKIDRYDLPGTLRNFDFPSPDTSAASRTDTAVPQQALFALNGPYLADWAAALAAETGGDVGAIYRRTLLRDPTAAERDRAAAFLAAAGENGPALLAQALLMSNEFAFLE